MRKGWYILTYHEVNWEENFFLRGLGLTIPPDLFQSQLRKLKKHFQFVSIQEGIDAIIQDKIKNPLLSIWFDDGYVGVRKYAYPVLSEYNLSAGISISSRFVLRKEFFWRSKLSYLYYTGQLEKLQQKLKKYGFNKESSVKKFMLNNFSIEILGELNQIFYNCTTEEFRQDAFRIFDTFDGINILKNSNWEICNHSAGHYPITEQVALHLFEDEFLECEKEIINNTGCKSNYWVAPFDRVNFRHETIITKLKKINAHAQLVLNNNKINTKSNIDLGFINRIIAPSYDGFKMIIYLLLI